MPFAGHHVGGVAHRVVVVHVPQSILAQAVNEFAVAVFVAETGFLHVIRNVGHAFHAARHHHIVEAEHDTLGGKHHRFGARCADLVNGGADRFGRQTGKQGGLPGGSLPQIGRHHVAHENFLHLRGLDPGFLQCAPDGERTQLGGRKTGQHTAKAANRRADSGNNIYFFHDEGIRLENENAKVSGFGLLERYYFTAEPS